MSQVLSRGAASADLHEPASDAATTPVAVATPGTRPGSSRVPIALAAITGVALATRIGVQDVDEVDLWWHLRVGEQVVATREVVWTDSSAQLADRPYVATQWLPEVVGYLSHDQFGLLGVSALRTLGVLALLVAVYTAARMAAGRFASAALAAVTVVGATGSLGPRPQIISFVLFALVVAACWRTAQDHRPRWWLVPVFWLWGCSHGLWAFGLVLLVLVFGALVADRSMVLRTGERRRLALLLAACVGALCLTPLGPGLLATPFSVASVAATVAQEWGPTPLYNVYALVTAGMVLAVVVLWVRRPANRPWWQIAMLVMAAGCTLWMWRLVPLGGILVAPLLAAELQARTGGPREVFTRSEARAAVALALTAGVAGLALVGTPASTMPGDTAAVDLALDSVPAGSVVYNEFGVSGWLLWRHPDLSPVIDLRGEIYDPEDFTAFDTVDRVERGWQDELAASGAAYALQPPGSPLATALVHRLGWAVTARSPGYVLLQAPPN